ncbi:hypothetical protein K2Y11_09720 [bacterium]|nr:hypothetical protein [bacterium]
MQVSLRFLILGLVFLPVGYTAFAQSSSDEFDEGVIRWFNGCSLELKSGVYRPDPYTGRIRIIGVDGKPKFEQNERPTESLKVVFSLGENANATANDFDVAANFRGFGSSAFLKLKRAESKGENTVNVSLVVCCRKSFGLTRLDEIKATQEYEELYKRDPRNADKKYGTHFVAAVEKTAGISVVLTYEMSTRDVSSIFSLNGGADIKFLGTGGDTETKLTESFNSANQQGKVQIRINTHGAEKMDFDINPILQRADLRSIVVEIGNLITNLSAAFNRDRAIDTRFYLARFRDLIDMPDNRDLWRQQQEDKLRNLVENYDRTSVQLQRIDDHLDAVAGSQFPAPTPNQRVEIKKIRDKLKSYQDEIVSAHKALVDTEQVPNDPQEPMLTASEMEAFWIFVSSKTPYELVTKRVEELENKVKSTPRVVWMRKVVKATGVAGRDARSLPIPGEFSVDFKDHPSKPKTVLSAEAIPISTDLTFLERDGIPNDKYIMKLKISANSLSINGTNVSGKYHFLMRDENDFVGREERSEDENILLIVALVQD